MRAKRCFNYERTLSKSFILCLFSFFSDCENSVKAKLYQIDIFPYPTLPFPTLPYPTLPYPTKNGNR